MLLVDKPSEDIKSIMKRLNMCESFYIAIDDEESYDALMFIFVALSIEWASGEKANSLHRNYSWFKREANGLSVYVEYLDEDRKYILWAEIINDRSYYNDTLIHFNKGG